MNPAPMQVRTPLAGWLDRNVPGWRAKSPEELDLELRRRFRAGEFARLVASTYAPTGERRVEPVKVGYVWYVTVVL